MGRSRSWLISQVLMAWLPTALNSKSVAMLPTREKPTYHRRRQIH